MVTHGPRDLKMSTSHSVTGWWSGFFYSAFISTLPSFSSSSFLVTRQHPLWVRQGSVHLFLQSPSPHHQVGFVLQPLLFHSGDKGWLFKGATPSVLFITTRWITRHPVTLTKQVLPVTKCNYAVQKAQKIEMMNIMQKKQTKTITKILCTCSFFSSNVAINSSTSACNFVESGYCMWYSWVHSAI